MRRPTRWRRTPAIEASKGRSCHAGETATDSIIERQGKLGDALRLCEGRRTLAGCAARRRRPGRNVSSQTAPFAHRLLRRNDGAHRWPRAWNWVFQNE